jgi:probable F420-dependent oxidoreductase
LVLAEHVLGADPDRPGGWDGPYTHHNIWPEPFVTLGYLAAVTERIELMTGVLVLPQRQTALVAKQAAQLDVLSGGRFILGIGTGWNHVEYQALGEDFSSRGRRMDEQIALMRRLWSDDVVTFDGTWDRVELAGINPRPVGADIPVWMGGSAPRAIDRIGRAGDGWFPLFLSRGAITSGIERIRAVAAEAGRDPTTIGLQCVVAETGDHDRQVEVAQGLAALGATHVGLATQGSPLGTSVGAHIAAATRFAEALS